MKNLFFLPLVFILISCSEKKKPNQHIEIGKHETIFEHFQKPNDTLYVVNFWATWCAPCVEELPHFINANEKFKNEKFKLILISLDRSKDFETKMKPFLKENNITADVYLLDDNTRMNTWIPIINKQWDGQIPVTALYKNNQQIGFIPNTLNEQTLNTIIKQNL